MHLARNLVVPGSRLGSSSLPVISGSPLGKLNYWRSTHMLMIFKVKFHDMAAILDLWAVLK